MRAIYWIRNDLRFQDNLALIQFCKEADEGLVVWCGSRSLDRAGPKRRAFIYATLKEFSQRAEANGVPVMISEKYAPDILPELVATHRVDTLFVSAEVAPEEREDERRIEKESTAQLIRVVQSNLIHPNDLPFSVEETPEIFTQFRIKVEKNLQISEPVSVPTRFPAALVPINLTTLTQQKWSDQFHSKILPGESAGLQRVQEYIWTQDRLQSYKETRNGMLDWDDSSKFSPWLSVGALSPRTLYFEIRRYERERVNNQSTYWLVFELLWRDYFRLMMEKKQARVFGLKPLLTLEQSRDLEAWCQANTGDDFIDANLTELNQTGWMSNRGRQNVASFLAKKINVPWHYGADYFEQQLIDYDVSNNWCNWAYLAGVGQDPRNRKFDSERQARIYDPEELYRKKWLMKL